MELEDRLYDLAMAYWDLQKNNYDIETNHEELLDCDLTEPDLIETLDGIIARAQQIRKDKPPREPEVDDIFRGGSAPVPNNSAINVVTRSIMSGGNDFESKPGGWERRKSNLIYEESFEKAGKITISIKECENPEDFVRSLNVFTLDVLIGIIRAYSFKPLRGENRKPVTWEIGSLCQTDSSVQRCFLLRQEAVGPHRDNQRGNGKSWKN